MRKWDLPMSLDQLRQETNDKVTRFLWRQWAQLGVASEVEFRDQWIIDPEALLVFTLELGRTDPRLIDEVIDWGVRNGRWLSLQRLRNVAESSAGQDTARAIAAFAAAMDARERKSRWKALCPAVRDTQPEPEAYFVDATGRPLPLVGEPDQGFLRAGYLRPRISARGMSMPVPMRPPTNLLFRLRALFGLGPRAEAVAYLLTHQAAHASEVARGARYSHTQVQDALAELASSDFAFVRLRGRQKVYALDAQQWRRFLEMDEPLPLWIHWPRALAAVSRLSSFLARVSSEEVSDYLLRSEIRTISDELQTQLGDTGLANPFEKSLSTDDAYAAFEGRVRAIAEQLAPNSR